jgi:hypothetical protein
LAFGIFCREKSVFHAAKQAGQQFCWIQGFRVTKLLENRASELSETAFEKSEKAFIFKVIFV